MKRLPRKRQSNIKIFGLSREYKQRHMLVSILLLCVLSLAFASCNQQPSESKRIALIFRYDDYSAITNTEIEKQIISAFTSIGKPFTIGITAFRETSKPGEVIKLPPEKADLLKRAAASGIVDIAQHGYTHHQVNDETRSEFSTLALESQIERISTAKSYLEETLDMGIKTFIPPWNTYDLNTVKALETLGFKTLSAGNIGPVPDSSTLNYLPATAELSTLKNDIIKARRSPYDHVIAVVLFHQYSFTEVDPDLGVMTISDFSDLLAWLNTQDDIDILSMNQAVLAYPDLTAQRYEASQQNTPGFIFVESTLNETALNDFMYKEGRIPLVSWLKVIGFYGIILILGAALVFFVERKILKLSRALIRILLGLSVLGSVAITVYGLRDGIVYRPGGLMITLAFSASLGLLMAFIKKDHLRKQRVSN